MPIEIIDGKEYDISHCAKITAYADPNCRHIDSIPYDTKSKGRSNKITQVQEICPNCGQLSEWAKTSKHDIHGHFTHVIKFNELRG